MKPWQRRFLQARSALADATAVQLTRLADPLAQAVRTISAPSRDEKRNAATIGAEWTTSVSLFASPADDPHGGDQWLRAREPLGLRLHRLGRLGALDTRGATPPRPLGSRLLRGALAAPFVLAWYAIALAAIAFFIYLTLFLTTFMYMLTYGLIILMITLVVTLATHR